MRKILMLVLFLLLVIPAVLAQTLLANRHESDFEGKWGDTVPFLSQLV